MIFLQLPDIVVFQSTYFLLLSLDNSCNFAMRCLMKIQKNVILLLHLLLPFDLKVPEMNTITSDQWKAINDIVLTLYDKKIECIFEDTMDALKDLVPHTHSLAYYQLKSLYPGSPFVLKSRNIPESFILSYMDKYSSLDFINWYTDSRFSEIFRESDIVPDQIRSQSVFYKEWMAPLDIFHGVCMLTAAEEESKQFGAMFLYRPASEQNFSDNELEILRVVNEHVSHRFSQYPAIHNIYDSSSVSGILVNSVMLNKRESEIINLIKAGTLRSDLPDVLFITKNTLNKHLDNIYKKLKINTFEELLHII